jgi:hypothetical protein
MDGETPLWQAHDLSQQLQDKIESLPGVERAFVHVDHETTHKPVSARGSSAGLKSDVSARMYRNIANISKLTSGFTRDCRGAVTAAMREKGCKAASLTDVLA